jgi:RNA-directed DNA polymerase
MTDIEAKSHTGVRTLGLSLPIIPLLPQQWDWSQIDWKRIERSVDSLQKRIYKAVKNGRRNLARKLSKLLLRSTSSICLNVRKVTQDNQGRRTAGVDGRKALEASARKELVEEIIALSNQNWGQYKASSIKRVYIPKTPTKKRPLGIPTLKDRVIQGLEKTALEPYWEARFEANSYGFRPAHCTFDAIEAIFIIINRQQKWILDADLTGCFDNIAHKPLLEKLKTFRVGNSLNSG